MYVVVLYAWHAIRWPISVGPLATPKKQTSSTVCGIARLCSYTYRCSFVTHCPVFSAISLKHVSLHVGISMHKGTRSGCSEVSLDHMKRSHGNNTYCMRWQTAHIAIRWANKKPDGMLCNKSHWCMQMRSVYQGRHKPNKGAKVGKPICKPRSA